MMTSCLFINQQEEKRTTTYTLALGTFFSFSFFFSSLKDHLSIFFSLGDHKTEHILLPIKVSSLNFVKRPQEKGSLGGWGKALDEWVE